VARKVLAGRREAVWKVSTGPARKHVARLRAAGWSMQRIADRAGVAPCTLWRLGRARRCWNLVSDAILRLQP
jgi:hypothetical protein